MRRTQINKLANANVYLNGESFLGRAAEVTLPDVKNTTSEIAPLGMVGKVDLPDGFDKMEAKFKWNSVYPEVYAETADPRRAVLVQCRGNLETHSGGGLENEVPFIVEMGGRFFGNNLGTLKQNDANMPEQTMAVTYLKITIDGEEVLEIDVIENIYRVNGEDIMATFRRNVGA